MAFWGLVLEPMKSYTQHEVEKPFHVSMAALDLKSCDNDSVSVVCRKRDSDFILCSLSKKHNIFNVPLNLDFELGSEINFHVLGNSAVHLTGYMIEDMESFEESDDSMGEEEESEASAKDTFKNTKKMLEAAAGKRKQDATAQNKSKKAKLESETAEEEDDDDEDDSDFDIADSDDDEDVEGEEEEDDDDDDDDDDDEDDEEADKAAEILQKLVSDKKDKSKQGGKNNQPSKASPKAEQKQGKKEKKDQAKPVPTKAVNGSPAQTNGATNKQTLQGGVQIEDLRVGNGPVAKSGKMVAVYYVGRLKQTNKQFDATQSGPGFKFRLGKGEVITGWDVGVAGMKVGGKRRLTIPPKMGYGTQGAGKDIPPNSTLVFEVELKNVK